MFRRPFFPFMWVVLVIVSLFSACSNQQGPASKNGSTVDLDRLTARAQAENKDVYLEFTSSTCLFCWGYNRTLTTPESQAALRKVIFVQANYERNPDLASQYNVSAVPTGLLLKPRNGQLQVVDRHVGALSQDRLVRFVSR